MGETLRSSSRLSAAVLFSRILGVVRESVFAALLGASALADAYQVAFRIPNLLRDLFAEGALSSAFVPAFTAKLVDEGKDAALRLGNLVLAGVSMITGGLSLLAIMFADELVAAISGGFAGDVAKTRVTIELTRIMMPILWLVSASAVWMGMLNAQRRFLAPALAPALFNVASIIVGAVLLMAGSPPEQAVTWWSVGTLLAAAVQLVAQLPALWKLGYRPLLRLVGLCKDPSIRRIVALLGPAVIGLAAVQINVFVNTRFAAELGDGPVSQLAWAFRLFYLPIGMFGVALAVVTTTRVSEDAARGDRKALAARTREGLDAVWMLTTASAVGLFVLAEPIVSLVYEHGRFTKGDTLATASVLCAYVVGLAPYSVVKILAPGFYGVDKPRIPLLASVLAVIVNVTFNAATYQRLGAPGIALGTTLGAFVNMVVLRIGFDHMIATIDRRDWSIRWGSLVLANAVLAAVVWSAWLGITQLASSFESLAFVLTRIVGLVAIVLVGFLAYVWMLARLRYPGAASLLDMSRSLLGRRAAHR